MVVLMTIWPPEEKWSKAFWLLVILIFTGLEIQSIYKDREEYDKQRLALVKEERDGFNSMFAQFSTLIKRQEELFGRQEKLSKKTFEKVTEREGALIPENLPNPVTRCNVPPRKQSLYFGSNVTWDMHFPYTVLNIHGEDIISLDQGNKEGFFISAKIFDDRGDLVVNIQKNKFLATYAASHLERTKSSIIIYDHRGKVALSVHSVNPYSIKIAGNFYSPDGVKINVDDKQINIGDGRFVSSGSCYSGGAGWVKY